MLSRVNRPAPLTFLAASLLACITIACEKVPLMAPSGSTITMTASANAISADGSVDLIVYVLEAAGTPPHSGTQVLFTTTLGTVRPSEARTDVNGRVVVTFMAGGSNGTATVSASSGGATTGTDGAVTIAVGTAAVGRVALSANPSTLVSSGGTARIATIVIDVNGNPLGSAAVYFSTSTGSLASSIVNTDSNGLAETTLTTSVEATVTATVGAGAGDSGGSMAEVTVTVAPMPAASITVSSDAHTAGSPVVFEINASPGTDSPASIREVVIDYGDGRSDNLGDVSGTDLAVQHEYSRQGTYTVRLTVSDTLGGVATAATIIVVQPPSPIGIVTAKTQATDAETTTVSFTATVTPSTAIVTSYLWNFGDEKSQTSTSGQVVHQYDAGSGVKIITVTATTALGQTGTGTTFVTP